MAAWNGPPQDSVSLPRGIRAERAGFGRPAGRFAPLPAARPCPGPPGPGADERARTPIRFRDRVLAQFRSLQNEAYLRGVLAAQAPTPAGRAFLLATLGDALVVFSEKEGRALDVLLDDPVALRGRNRAGASLWSEIRRLNLAFAVERLSLLRERAAQLDPGPPRDGVDADDEPYHFRMFVGDSLRPPGLEHLNSPGPWYALREDQSTWNRPGAWSPGPADPRLGKPRPAAGGRGRGRGQPPAGREGFEGSAPLPWGRGDIHLDPEQAVSEYWSDSKNPDDSALGSSEAAGETYGSESAWGEFWPDRGGTRFMRYTSPPFWQKGGREGYEYDIEETLGVLARETDNPVRRWDMDRLREPRGEEYRRLGPRSGHAV